MPVIPGACPGPLWASPYTLPVRSRLLFGFSYRPPVCWPHTLFYLWLDFLSNCALLCPTAPQSTWMSLRHLSFYLPNSDSPPTPTCIPSLPSHNESPHLILSPHIHPSAQASSQAHLSLALHVTPAHQLSRFIICASPPPCP